MSNLQPSDQYLLHAHSLSAVLTPSLRRVHTLSSSFSLFLFAVAPSYPSRFHLQTMSRSPARLPCEEKRGQHTRETKRVKPQPTLTSCSPILPSHHFIDTFRTQTQSPHPELKCSTTSEKWAFHLLDFPRIARPTSHTQLLSIINSR